MTIFEKITAENLARLMKGPIHRFKSRINLKSKKKKTTPRHIILEIQTPKHEEKTSGIF